MKNNWFRISSIIVLFTLLNQALSYAQTTPSATIEGDTAVCEKGEIHLKIKFQGKSPFGFIYKSEKLGTFLRTDPIFEGQLTPDGYYIENIQVFNTDRFELVEFFDGNLELSEWIIGKGYATFSGSADVQVDRTPVPEAGENATGCGYSYALKATPQDPSNEMFWDDITNGSFTDKTDPNTVFTADVAGAYLLTFNEKSGTCIGKDQVTINLYGSPKSSIAGETTICSTDGDIHLLPLTVTLEGTEPFTYKLSDGASINQTYYNKPAGTTSLSLPATGNTEYKIIEIKDFNNCLADADDMTGKGLVIDNKPNPFAGDDAISCAKDYTLNATPNENAPGTWTTETSGITIKDINTATSNVSVTDFGVFRFLWTETHLGCVATDEVEIRFDAPPTLTLLQPDTAICEGSLANLRLLTLSETSSYPLSLNYSIEESNSTDIIHTPAKSIGLSPIVNSVYQLDRITNSYGCFTDLTNQFAVDVYSVPVANAGDDIEECGSTGSLKAQITDGNNGFWSSEFNFFDDHTNPQTTFTLPPDYKQKATEDFELTWTEINGQNNNCIAQQNITLTLYQQPEDIDAIQDTTLYYNTNSVLVYGQSKDNMHENMTTFWKTESTGIKISNPSFTETTISDIEKGSHVLIWKVENGTCAVVTDSITIIYTGLKAPNGFSPDGDGINDVFRIGGSEQINNHEFIVFNTNGKVVYSTTKLTPQGWDGVGFDGPLQDGTYYYIFKGDGINPRKEYLVIKSK